MTITSRYRAHSLLPLWLILVAACRNPDRAPDAAHLHTDSLVVVSEVEQAVWTFHAADTARDAEAVVGLLWPEFEIMVDGSRLGYEEVVGGTRDFMENLEVFATEWTDLRIVTLGSRHAIASFLFRDSIVTVHGEVSMSRGPTTFVWEKRGDQWRVLFADADHYPIDDTSKPEN